MLPPILWSTKAIDANPATVATSWRWSACSLMNIVETTAVITFQVFQHSAEVFDTDIWHPALHTKEPGRLTLSISRPRNVVIPMSSNVLFSTMANCQLMNCSIETMFIFCFRFFDYTTLKCKAFHYSGCDGNENRFDSKKACEETCFIKYSF